MDYSIIVDALSQVKGVKAVVLGGSQSSGTATAESDYDIGVYYDPAQLDVAALGAAVSALNDEPREGIFNPPGTWGPWINGGGWLTIGGKQVDILLKDIARISAVLDDCVRGAITIDYQCGHPFGFVNTIYAAETHYAMPLWQDDSAPVDMLKAKLGGYPIKMKTALIERFMWEAWFSIECTRKATRKGDMNHTVGSVFRAACAWTQAVYALNEVFLMNEKGALNRIDGFALAPKNMKGRIEEAYAMIGQGEGEAALSKLDALHDELQTLTTSFDVPEQRIR